MELKPEDIVTVGEQIPIPDFSSTTIESLLVVAEEALKKAPTLLNINDKFVIVGDIHGNLHDLLRIFSTNGYPPLQKYLFLGDIVDRGEYQVECITLVLSLLVKYPESVYLLRGNHEFKYVNSVYGFYDKLVEVGYTEELYEKFNTVFNYLPLVAILNNKYFCVHGGISKDLTSFDLLNIEKPIVDDNDNTMLNDLMWSDPTPNASLYLQSNRGKGNEYGRIAVEEFLKRFKLIGIIRAHQMVDGIYHCFSRMVTTVFSSSDYKGDKKNRCGFIEVDLDGKMKSHILECIEKPTRADAFLLKCALDAPQSDNMKLSDLRCSKISVIVSSSSSKRVHNFFTKKNPIIFNNRRHYEIHTMPSG